MYLTNIIKLNAIKYSYKENNEINILNTYLGIS